MQAGDVIKVGKTVELECLDTPGHTMCHICLRSHTEQPALFSGDTLFNAGAGNVHNGGDVHAMYTSFADQLAKLPGNTLLYPGHDYIETNLKFTLAREPDNAAAKALLPSVVGHDPQVGGDHPARRKTAQHLLQAHQPQRDRPAPGELFRTCRSIPMPRRCL